MNQYLLQPYWSTPWSFSVYQYIQNRRYDKLDTFEFLYQNPMKLPSDKTHFLCHLELSNNIIIPTHKPVLVSWLSSVVLGAKFSKKTTLVLYSLLSNWILTLVHTAMFGKPFKYLIWCFVWDLCWVESESWLSTTTVNYCLSGTVLHVCIHIEQSNISFNVCCSHSHSHFISGFYLGSVNMPFLSAATSQ